MLYLNTYTKKREILKYLREKRMAQELGTSSGSSKGGSSGIDPP